MASRHGPPGKRRHPAIMLSSIAAAAKTSARIHAAPPSASSLGSGSPAAVATSAILTIG
jgi:hypothetical protein